MDNTGDHGMDSGGGGAARTWWERHVKAEVVRDGWLYYLGMFSPEEARRRLQLSREPWNPPAGEMAPRR